MGEPQERVFCQCQIHRGQEPQNEKWLDYVKPFLMDLGFVLYC